MMFQKRLNLIVPKFLFVFVVLVIHNETPVHRFDCCLIEAFLFSFEFLVGEEVTGHHFPFFIGAEEGILNLFPVFLDEIDLSSEFHIMCFFLLIFPQIVHKVISHLICFLLFYFFFILLLGVEWDGMSVNWLIRGKSRILNAVEFFGLLGFPRVDILLLYFEFGWVFYITCHFIYIPWRKISPWRNEYNYIRTSSYWKLFKLWSKAIYEIKITIK